MTVIGCSLSSMWISPQAHPAWIRFFAYKMLLSQSLYYTFKKKNNKIQPSPFNILKE